MFQCLSPDERDGGGILTAMAHTIDSAAVAMVGMWKLFCFFDYQIQRFILGVCYRPRNHSTAFS